MLNTVIAGPAPGRKTSTPIPLRHLTIADLGTALTRGFADWRACHTEVPVLALMAPVGGILLAAMAAAPALMPFLFPICAGFALLGPLTSLWFAALSRDRELHGGATADAAGQVFDSPRRITIQRLGLLMVSLFLAWIVAAGLIYQSTLGQHGPTGGLAFFTAVFTSPAGWTMLEIGILTGFVFAALVLGVGLIAFPLALDRDVTFTQACATSLRVLAGSPLAVLVWGGLVATLMAIGTLPALLGLALVLPLLGHTTWHIYRLVTAA